jgi:hypothetical protein
MADPRTNCVVLVEVNGLTFVSIVAGIILVIGLVIAIAYVISLVGPRFFGDDPGGRDPNLVGQFHMWGTGPRYIEFLRWKRKLGSRRRSGH